MRTLSPSAMASASTRCTLRPVSALAVSTRGRRRSFWWTFARSWSRSASSIAATSHLFSTSAVAQPSFMARSAMRRSWAVTPSWASQTTSGDVGALDRPLRAQRRVVLDGVRDLGLAAQPGGVDEDDPAAVDLEREVDRVAGRAGHLADDHALLAQQPVDERRLADVGAPDDGQADRVVVLLGDLLLRRGQALHDRVEQVARAEPLHGGDRHRVAQAQPVEVGGQRDVLGRVDLVGGHERRAGARGAAGRPAPRRRAARRPGRRRRARRPPRRPGRPGPARGSTPRSGRGRGSPCRPCRRA